MSTAATTTTTTMATMPSQGSLPLKATPESAFLNSYSSSAEATLHSLYNRAAQAFLYRDIALTTSLIASAFALLHPPIAPAPDPFDAHRRKWDILRISLESTVYASPPDRAALPETLRELLLLSPRSLLAMSHARSLALFTPSSLPRTPTSAFLPHQILITHIGSSLKVDCPAAGREMVEDWLSNRGQYDYIPSTGEAYDKVLELYCLHILPRLGEWEYAKEFLSYDVELPQRKRTEFQASLDKARREKAIRTPVAASPRIPSPTPSASSSNSSLSTTSNRTVVPLTSLSQLDQRRRSTSPASIASDVTVTKSPSRPNPRDLRSTPRASPRTSVVRGSQNPIVATTGQSPGTLALIRDCLRAYFAANRFTALTVLFLLLPMVSYIIRRRARAAPAPAPASTADQVKRRLFDARSGSILHALWSEVGRAIWDTVRMGGGGLV